MYLRISTIVEGKVDEYYSPEKFDAVANEDLDDLKVEIDTSFNMSPRGVSFQTIRQKGLLISFYKNEMINARHSFLLIQFNIEAKDYAVLDELEANVIEFIGIKIDLKTLMITFPTGKKSPCIINDLNLPQGFLNSLTQASVLLHRPTVELMQDKDLLKLSLLSQPFYPADYITMDYVQIARKKMITKGFVEEEDFHILDDEVNFLLKGTIDNVYTI